MTFKMINPAQSSLLMGEGYGNSFRPYAPNTPQLTGLETPKICKGAYIPTSTCKGYGVEVWPETRSCVETG